jgi:hypothetical protein
MRINFKFLALASAMLFGLAACNLPLGSGSPDTVATMRALTTAQAATLQALQTSTSATPTLSSLPTLSFPTLPPLNTPGTITPIPTVQGANTATPISYCDWAAYVKDVTIPDGTILAPGTAFKKTWRLQNIGTCAWTTSYDLVFSSGDLMGGAAAVGLSTTVYPDQTVDVSVNLRAPAAEGRHRGYWGLRNASGVIFGIGNTSKDAFYVDIKVVGGMTTVFDFAANYCQADWRSEAGDLGCPGNEGGKKGYAIQITDPQLEDGTTYHGLGILTVPQRIYNGYLQGYYQAFAVRNGDRFRAIINCEYLDPGCDVLFRLDYQIGSGSLKTFWQFLEAYDGKYYTVDLDLSSFAGKNVKFILTVLADGSADADKPVWVAPRIDRPTNLITPSTTPTQLPTMTKTVRPTKTPTSGSTVPPGPPPTVTPTPTMLILTPTITITPTVTPTAT